MKDRYMTWERVYQGRVLHAFIGGDGRRREHPAIGTYFEYKTICGKYFSYVPRSATHAWRYPKCKKCLEKLEKTKE